ncbi:MAG TPA: hypothetical protein VE953_19385 [Terriglobales bacterium]|nr:hypothetical protein [Terriglobales bacterium]
MGDARILLALPLIGQPPWWLSRGDRPCWYTLRELLQRTTPVVRATR